MVSSGDARRDVHRDLACCGRPDAECGAVGEQRCAAVESPGSRLDADVALAVSLEHRRGRAHAPTGRDGAESRGPAGWHEPEPVEFAAAHGEQVGIAGDGWKCLAAPELHRGPAVEFSQVELRVLGVACEVVDAEDHFVLVASEECEHSAVLRGEGLEGASAERPVAPAQCDDAREST